MTSYEGLKRLSQEQQRALSQTEDDLNRWETFREDYLKVQKKVSELPDQISYDYMVPFGPLAFMPGQLIHTNEILVLLGDNWFAEMSAKQACGVIDRRLSEIGKSIKGLNEQKKLLQSRSEFTHNEFTSNSKEIEITEDYDSDTERKWREAHRRRVRKEKLSHHRDGKCETDSDVLQRLQDLQLQEMRGHEMSRLDENQDEASTSAEESISNATKKNSVHWAREQDKPDTQLNLPESSSSSSSDLSSEDDSSSADLDSDDSQGGAAAPHASVIYFKHSPRSDTEEPQDSTGTQEQGEAVVNSPSDIYKIYSKPKSILKNTGTFETVKATQPLKEDRKEIKFHENQTAVKSYVMEKDSKSESIPTLSEPHSAVSSDNHSKPPQRMSKFKAMRQKKSS